MTLNPDRVGHAYPAYRYEVSRAKIREYADALGESDPRYRSDGDDCVAPPTFAAAFTVPQGLVPVMADDELGFHPAVVHGAQGYDFGDRPLRPGDVLACTTAITGITHRGANEFLSLAVDCRHADTDELAAHATTTLVLLGSAPQETP